MLYHQGTTVLESQRLLLRAFIRDDAEAMFKNWAGDDNTTKFLIWDTYKNQDQAEKMIRQWEAAYLDENMYHWAVVLKEIEEPIGSVSVVRNNETMENCEVGFCLGSHWWGQGYCTEALGLVLDFLFGQVGFQRVECRHAVENIASEKVQLKVGMVREGILRQAYKNKDGHFSDVVINAITRGEWEVM